MRPQLSRLRHPPTARCGARGSRICARTPRLPPVPPLFGRPPGLGLWLPRPAAGPSALESRVRSGLGSAATSLPGQTLLGMLSAPPGTRLSRSQDRVSGFSRLPRGHWGREAGRQSAPCSSPGCGRPHRKIRANQGPEAGLRPSRPPSGLIESYIKKFSSEREKERGAEAKRERESVPDRKERPRVSEARKR